MSHFEDPVILTCSISGAVANRDQCPAIPYTPEEYAAEARRIVDEGGAMIHIHARTPDGTPSYEVEDFRNITDAILSEVDDVIINYSTGAVGVPIEKRIEYLRELRPEVGALNMGSMNYAKYSKRRKQFVFHTVFENSFDTIITFLNAMNELGIKPEHFAEFPMLTWGDRVAEVADDVMRWIVDTFGGATEAFKNFISTVFLNPLQSLIAQSPAADSAWDPGPLGRLRRRPRRDHHRVLPGRNPLPRPVARRHGHPQHDAGRHDPRDDPGPVLRSLDGPEPSGRPGDVGLALDAGQTIPPFVFLIPVLALFGPTRFTAIVAGIVYAAPPAIKLVADGIRGVSPTTVEAGGSTDDGLEEITNVQIPMAGKLLIVLATNQGLLDVLAMTVIGGLVGRGCARLRRRPRLLRERAAGHLPRRPATIVLLGVMLDRITRAAAERRAT